MAERRPVITLMTDFGEADYYVAAMKGAILTVNPQAEIVDLTHQVPPHDLYTAAFTLLCCYADFPKMTLHVVVERMESRELEQVALVAAVQRQSGGNTAEVLDRVVAFGPKATETFVACTTPGGAYAGDLAGLVRDAGFDPVIVGSLARGKEFEPDTSPYNTGMSGQQLRTLFGQATGGHD